MALTSGTGPLAPRPAGRFNVELPHDRLVFWEPFAKRFRVVVQGAIVADSRDVLAVHQSGQLMRVAVPMAEVQSDQLVRSSELKDRLGAGHRWSASDGQVVARSIDVPPEGAEALKDHIIFDLAKVDAWYLDDDLGYAHPRDPYHRVDVHRSSRHVMVKLGNTIVAECSNPAILYETALPPGFYLPPDALRIEYLERSETVTECPYKGDGQHWHVVIDGQRVEDACWSLATPLGDALTIPRWFSFYPNKVQIEVDGQLLGQG